MNADDAIYIEVSKGKFYRQRRKIVDASESPFSIEEEIIVKLYDRISTLESELAASKAEIVSLTDRFLRIIKGMET